MPRDADLIAIEQQIRHAIRDAVNRTSRKPFTWGGLAGYEQLEAIAQALHGMPNDSETVYLRSLLPQLDRALDVNQSLADDVRAAHTTLRRIADCLHYPGDEGAKTTGPAVRQAMDSLLAEFRPDPTHQPAQAALQCGWHRVWKAWANDLLTCYEIAGLPADNLQLESFFNRLRQNERRISGRASSRPLGA